MRENGFYYIREKHVLPTIWTIGRCINGDWQLIGRSYELCEEDLVEDYFIGDKIPDPCS